MPISSADLQIAGKTSIDDYLRNSVVDQIGEETPLLKKLMSKRKLFLGAKQNIVAQIRKDYGTNFQWIYGEQAISFNKRDTVEQAQFQWRHCVDGFYIAHDTLFSNGIKVREGDRGAYRLENNEKVQLTHLLNEQSEAFRLGFTEKLSLELHRDGTSSNDAVTGLDALIATDPTTGTVGGINRATATYWRNQTATGLTAANLIPTMEKVWRECTRHGGKPDYILAGGDFIDLYCSCVPVTRNINAGSQATIEAARDDVRFKGIPIIWDPQFDTLDALDSPTIPWAKRCYFINSKFLQLHDDDMDIVSPNRPYNILALYQMIDLRLALTMTRANCHAVLSIS